MKRQIAFMAAMAAALGTTGAVNVPAPTGIHSKLIAQKPTEIRASRVSSRNLMLAGGYRARHSKPWPFRGKNRSQRQSMNLAFFNISR